MRAIILDGVWSKRHPNLGRIITYQSRDSHWLNQPNFGLKGPNDENTTLRIKTSRVKIKNKFGVWRSASYEKKEDI